MKKKLFYIVLVALSGVILVNGCKNYSSTTPYPMAPSTTGTSAMVSISNFAFVPDTIIVKTGTTVTWTNMDSTPHTVTSTTGLFDSGSIPTSSTFRYPFASAGTFVYHCTIHSMMKSAVVIVSN
jgi:plastocyanin